MIELFCLAYWYDCSLVHWQLWTRTIYGYELSSKVDSVSGEYKIDLHFSDLLQSLRQVILWLSIHGRALVNDMQTPSLIKNVIHFLSKKIMQCSETNAEPILSFWDTVDYVLKIPVTYTTVTKL